MKKYLRSIKGLSLALLFAFCGSCTNLDEELYGRLSPNNYYNTEAEVLSALAGVYRTMSYAADGGNTWRLLHYGTDEFLIPARSDGRWFDGGVHLEFARHAWTPLNNRISSGWSNIFLNIGTANAVLESLRKSPQQGLAPQIAEVRAIRAYSYFYALDLWGSVPIVTTERIDPNNRPTNAPRADVFNFVVTELREAIKDLPSIKDVNRATYYPRMTKESAYGVLALTYLNGEVYTGRSYWQECLEACNFIINSGAYSLTPNYLDNFTANNHTSPEFVFAISIDPGRNALSNQFVLRVLHDSHRLRYGLPFTPQNGFTTMEEAFDRYEDRDKRKAMFLHGPQFDASGNPLKTVSGNTNLVLIPHQNMANAGENEGYRVVKWQPDPAWVGSSGGNDYALIRYSEILLTKAEALQRSGTGAAEALALVNQVRRRSDASELTALTPTTILDERGRELIYEGTRRRDMIRFGTFFTGTWKFKTSVTPMFRKVLPIPVTEMNANPALKQNDGY